MELWDLYDAERRLTGQTMVRGEPVPPGRYHLVVHVCLFNAAGQLLIQQRQPWKPTWSNMWDLTVGGAAVSGDTSCQAAMREVEEEIGLRLNLEGRPCALSVTFPDGFDDFYIVQQEVDPASLRLQQSEVQAVRWASMEEIFAMIDSGEFIPYEKNFLAYLFFRRTGTGARSRGRMNA